MDESILKSIKKLLGIEDSYKHFDQDIIIHINTAFMILTQLGVGPASGFSITDDTTTWSEYSDATITEAVKTYIYLKVRLLFDPPTSSAYLDSMKNLVAELEWRLMVEAENVRDSIHKHCLEIAAIKEAKEEDET